MTLSGTGKTRTSASLTDVLSRGGYVTNTLFLADRTALVKQAKDDFKNYLPDMSLCNLCENKEDRNARIVFSTYPTMLHAIDDCRTGDGTKLFSPAHFDLIIIDESHRSIFKKYRAIFDYFDTLTVGLTATPKTDVDRNTYDFFEMESGVPTYAYDYETAVNEDHVLVPYYNYEVKTKFLDEGITYDDLSEEDKERYEDVIVHIHSDNVDFSNTKQREITTEAETVLTPGIYQAGYDFPVGTYYICAYEGRGNVISYGANVNKIMSVEPNENYIYQYNYASFAEGTDLEIKGCTVILIPAGS